MFKKYLRELLIPATYLLILATPLFSASALGALERQPYLQSVSDTRVVLRWRTVANDTSRVNYGLDLFNLDNQVNDNTNDDEHEVVISGLTPNTKYYYSVGSTNGTVEAGNDADHYFITAPTVGSSQKLRIWAIGDPGTGTAAQRNVRDAYYNLDNVETNVVLTLGDNAYNDGTDSQYTNNFLNVYNDLFRNTPVWATRGNHERNLNAHETAFTHPTQAEAGGVASGSELYYSFDYGNIHFVCLDSFTSSNLNGTTMYDWLENDLASTTQKWIIAYWHHPPYSRSSSHDSNSESGQRIVRERANPILEKYGVDLQLGGHNHFYSRTVLINNHYGTSGSYNAATHAVDSGDGREDSNGVYEKGSDPEGAVYILAGSSGKVGYTPINHPANYTEVRVLGSMVIDVDVDRMDVRMLRENGNIQDYFSITKAPAGNQAPIVDAGNNQTVEAGVTANIDAFVSDDGLPTGQLTYSWSQVSGPGTAIFGSANAEDTTVELSTAGSYVLRLEVSDGELTGSDEVTLTLPLPPGSLILSEVLYDAVGPDDGLEWVELYNTTSEPIDLSTYSLGNGGNDYTYSTVQLSGVIQPGQTFVVGGPTSSAANGNPLFDQVINFTPDFQNVATAADGVALFNVLASAITPTMVPIDAIIYGATNSSGLIDESGVANAPDVADVVRGESIVRNDIDGSWIVQLTPTPNVASSGITSSGNGAPSFTQDPINKPAAIINAVYAQSLASDASDPDGDALSFIKLSGPNWLTVSIDGSLGGTPGLVDLGANSFAVEVMDSSGLSATAILSISVELDSTLPPGSLILSEVLYDGVGPDNGLEWVELYNSSDQVIDLSTYSLGNGGLDYTYSVVQLSGIIQPGQTFVVGGPTSSGNNSNPIFDQTINFTPDFQNVTASGDGVALFKVLASEITATTVPVDAVVYGPNNNNGLIDESGVANAPDVADPGTGISVERVDLNGDWVVQPNPTPGVVSAGIQPPPTPDLILSEVLYDGNGPDNGLEWVELYNTSDQPIDLSAYSLGNGGLDYTYSVVQLSGVIQPGQTFVVGGPTSTSNNSNPIFDQAINFTPDFQNVTTSGDGVALFNVSSSDITATTVPIDAVIYGPNNNNGLIDESGVANAPDVADPGRGISVERIDLNGNWAVQITPTPNVASSSIT